MVCHLDLDAWLVEIKAVERHVGRDATDPRLLIALWVFATLKGIGSARELERLCKDHLAYQWLCGGVSVNYHMLADFRSQEGEKWDQLLTQMVATLMDEAMSKVNRHFNVIAMTRHMEVDYLRPAPLHRDLVLVGHHTRREGRKLFHRAELRNQDGVVLAQAKGVFVAVDPALIEAAKAAGRI